eukprot:3084763-Ditylum_brightwellii.AAC.1
MSVFDVADVLLMKLRRWGAVMRDIAIELLQSHLSWMKNEDLQVLQNEVSIHDACVCMPTTDVSTESTPLGTGTPVLTLPTLPEKLAPTEFGTENLWESSNSTDSDENLFHCAHDCIDFLDTIELNSDDCSIEIEVESCGNSLV